MFTAVPRPAVRFLWRQGGEKYTVGVVNYMQDPRSGARWLQGPDGRARLRGRSSITYVYHGAVAPDPKVVESEVRGLLAQKVDLLLTMGTLPTRVAKQVVEGTNVPVVFSPVINPVDERLVQSVTRPGGNVTGVQNGTTIPKALGGCSSSRRKRGSST